jgi:NifB/MoaA-like Fe-S oxidoreductase
MSESSIRPAKINAIIPESIAEELGFEPGDAIASINGMKPRDLIDYQFLCADEYLELEVIDKQGKSNVIIIVPFVLLTNNHQENGKVYILKMMIIVSVFSTEVI